jgi:hypothetical protein
MSPLVRANVNGVELICVVAMDVTAGANAFAWTAGAPGVGQSADAGSSFIAFGASIALQVPAEEVAAEAETATTTLVVNRAVKATPVAIDEIALRMKTSPWTELNGHVAHLHERVAAERHIRV